MSKYITHANYYEHFIYHGSTNIECIRKRGRTVISREWMMFDTIEETQEYFNDYCGV
jgi:hypothetical protein